MKYRLLIGVATVTFVASTPAPAFFLTMTIMPTCDAEFRKIGVDIQHLGPREEARLHALINDVQTENAPGIRAKIVTDELKEFISHRRWEEMHPGQYLGRSQVIG